MIKVAEIERIRWRHFREGVRVRALAREFQRSQADIRRALAEPGRWRMPAEAAAAGIPCWTQWRG